MYVARNTIVIPHGVSEKFPGEVAVLAVPRASSLNVWILGLDGIPWLKRGHSIVIHFPTALLLSTASRSTLTLPALSASSRRHESGPCTKFYSCSCITHWAPPGRFSRLKCRTVLYISRELPQPAFCLGTETSIQRQFLEDKKSRISSKWLLARFSSLGMCT